MAKPRRKGESSNDYCGAIRTVKVRLHDLTDQQRERFMTLSVLMQRLHNRVMMFWYHWHLERGHDQVIRDWMEASRQWRRQEQSLLATLGEKPKQKDAASKWDAQWKKLRRSLPKYPRCPLWAWPKEFGKEVYRMVRGAWPQLSTRCITLALKILQSDWEKHKANTSRFKKWQLSLADLGELPIFARRQPIPISPDWTELIRPASDQDPWRAELRIERIDGVDGKTGTNVRDVVTLGTHDTGKRHIQRILEGCTPSEETPAELKFCGSELAFRDGKWFLHLCYRERKLRKADVDCRRKLIVFPDVHRPWSITMGDRTFPVGGPGRLVAQFRRRLRLANQTLGTARRHGRRKGKGHGKKVYAFRGHLARYKDTFTKVCVARVLKIAMQERIGTIVYLRPSAKTAAKTFLATAGTNGRPDSWPWEAVERHLGHVCERWGLKLIVKTDWDGGETAAGTPEKSPQSGRKSRADKKNGKTGVK